MTPRLRMSSLVFGLILVSGCEDSGTTPDPGQTDPNVLVTGYEILDAIAVIAEDEFLFSERSGALRHYVRGEITEIRGIPRSTMSDVYGGLLDVSLHPEFEENRLVYIAYDDASGDLTVARFELADGRATNLEILHRSDEFSIGSRIEWVGTSHFFMSFGVGGSPYPDPGPQSINSDKGKIHRFTADGDIPPDNPIPPGSSSPSTLWSYGHRNPQGLQYDAAQQTLYASEHGPLGGDELNIVTRGGNYGWPLFSYGLNYDRTPVSDMTEEQAAATSILPLKAWDPSFRVAPSGLLLMDGDMFPAWKGSFLMGSLYLQHLVRYDPATDETEILLAGVGRVRDVAQLPSGALLISLDAGSPTADHRGRIMRLASGNGLP